MSCQPLQCPREAGRRRVVPGDKQRHELIAEFGIGHDAAVGSLVTAGTDQHRQRVGACREIGIGAAVGDLGIQQAVGFGHIAAQCPPRPEPLQVRACDRQRCPRGHVEQFGHHLAQRCESRRVGRADDGPQDDLEGDLGHFGRNREDGVHWPLRHAGRRNLGHHGRLARDRVAVEGGQHLAPSLPVHVVVDHQYRAVAEQAAKHRVRFACVIDARDCPRTPS